MEGRISINVVPSDAMVSECRKLPENSVETASMRFGLAHGEALTVAMDALLRYAIAYKLRHGGPLSDDGVLGAPWLDAAKGVRALLNGDGSAAMAHDRTTDSKSNSVIEGLFWHALKAAGFTEGDL